MQSFRNVVVLALALHSCAPANPPRPPLDENASAETLAGALFHAVREFCVPYVVDGASEEALTRRPGITPMRYNVHGKAVTRYMLDLPNSPEVTFDEGDYCRVYIEDEPFSDRVAIVDAFMSDVSLIGKQTSEYQQLQRPGALVREDSGYGHTVCVHGNTTSTLSARTAPDTITSPFGGTLHNPPLVDVIVRAALRPENCTAEEG